MRAFRLWCVLLPLTHSSIDRVSLLGALCADTLQSHAEEFAPFCELSDDITSFEDYVEHVRNSAEWGGHLELRALSRALHRPVLVYSTRDPLEIKEEEISEGGAIDPIRLSYHHHYYALGEHYNEVVESVDGTQ